MQPFLFAAFGLEYIYPTLILSVLVALLLYAFSMKILTFVFARPLRVTVIRKEIETSYSQNGEHESYVLTVEHSEGVDLVEVSRWTFSSVVEGGTYLVRGKVWADEDFTVIGKWRPVEPVRAAAEQAINAMPVVPTQAPETARTSTATKVTLRCPKCGKRYHVKSTLAGKKAKCQCGAVITVPTLAVASSGRDGSHDRTGETFDIASSPDEYHVAPPPSRPCPGCGASIHPEDVVCVQCGYHVQRGQLQTKVNKPPLPAPPRGFRVEERGGSLVIAKEPILRVPIHSGIFAMGAAGLVTLLVLLLPFSLWSAVSILILAIVFALLQGTTFTIDHDRIVVRHVPFPWRDRNIRSQEVDQVYCIDHYHSGSEAPGGSGGYYTYDVKILTKKGRRITLASRFADEGDALFIEEWIERFLGIPDREVTPTVIEKYLVKHLGLRSLLLAAISVAGLGFMYYLSSSVARRDRLHDRSIQSRELEAKSFSSSASLDATSEADAPDKRYSLEFDGLANYVITPPLQYDGSYALTLEAWVRPSELTGVREVISNAQNAGAAIGFYDGICKFLVRDQRGYRAVGASATTKPGEELHIAGVFNGLTLSLFVNGRRQGTGAKVFGAHQPSSMPFMIGANPEPSKAPMNLFSGSIDEVRISSIVRYESDFSPQRRFTSDEYTVALYHFDRGTGNMAKDSSPNRYHGEIHGATWIEAGERQDVTEGASQ